MKIMDGARVAAAAAVMLAGLGASGCDSGGTEMTTGAIRCEGGNLCKSMGECMGKDGKNACTGMNECAGMGYITATSQADCDAKKAAAAEAAKNL
jgi:hypothetical protein